MATLSFVPMSEEELKRELGSLEPGKADFEITECSEKQSKSGNPMLEIKLKVWDKNGKLGFLFDYLVGIKAAQWKIKNLCDAIGQPEQYAAGGISDAFLVGKSGKCIIAIEKNEQYGERPKIKDYLPLEEKGINNHAPHPSPKDEGIDDDLPF